MTTGWNNATIEVGGVVDDLGGIQALPEQIQALAKQGDSGFFLPWVKSTGSEIFEEGLQGILERGLKTVYSDDIPIYSNENPNAIINPEMMKEEAKDALIINSMVGAGQISAEAVRRALQVPAKVEVNNQNRRESEDSGIQPQEGTNFPADPGDLETLNPETRLALNQDWKHPDDSPYADNNFLQDTSQHVKIANIRINKGVGAKAKNYDVIDPTTGELFHFVEGTKIQDAEVFAGYCTKKPLNEAVADGLAGEFGGDPDKWQHAKGIGTLDYYGEDIKAEVHWFQEESVGKVKFKVKEWKE